MPHVPPPSQCKILIFLVVSIALCVSVCPGNSKGNSGHLFTLFNFTLPKLKNNCYLKFRHNLRYALLWKQSCTK